MSCFSFSLFGRKTNLRRFSEMPFSGEKANYLTIPGNLKYYESGNKR